MPKATVLTILTVAVVLMTASAQEIEYELLFPNVASSDDLSGGYTTSIHSGARDVKGPFDGDGDGQLEIYVADYTAGGRVHVIENVGVDVWELVYTTPFLDSTASTSNIRAITVADLDGDQKGEIIFLGGRTYSETNPNIDVLPPGLYAFENVGDNDWGALPASVYEFDGNLPDRWLTELFDVADVDGDDAQELLMPNNGNANEFDNWYVFSVNGDLGSGFEVWVEELRLSSRAAEAFDPVDRGGGSPYSILAADLDGDGVTELSLHSWNNFNFTNVQATAPDTYVTPEAAGKVNVWYHASASDDPAFFGGVVVDVNGDGDDEVYYPNLNNGHVSVLNYEAGEDVLEVVADNIGLDVLDGLSSLGITAGDLDGDGRMELIGSGPAYGAASFDAGEEPVWFRIAEYQGGDVESAASYTIEDIPFPADMLEGQFNRIERDSAGAMSVYHEVGQQGPEFTSKLAYLGDPDGDGINELAIAIQGVDDSTSVISEVFNSGTNLFDRTTLSRSGNDHRVFLKVINGSGLAVDIVEERIVLPTDYLLFDNYPNPFNPTTTIGFELPLDKSVSVRIYDVTGRLVKSLVDNRQLAAGIHEVVWDGTSDAGITVASGTYIYTLEYGNFRQAKEMVFVK